MGERDFGRWSWRPGRNKDKRRRLDSFWMLGRTSTRRFAGTAENGPHSEAVRLLQRDGRAAAAADVKKARTSDGSTPPRLLVAAENGPRHLEVVQLKLELSGPHRCPMCLRASGSGPGVLCGQHNGAGPGNMDDDSALAFCPRLRAPGVLTAIS